MASSISVEELRRGVTSDKRVDAHGAVEGDEKGDRRVGPIEDVVVFRTAVVSRAGVETRGVETSVGCGSRGEVSAA